MNSAFVLCAYFAMVLSPCIVAQWGDLLNVRWMLALARRRRTHWHESFRVSFRHERYAMAVAVEASFASANSDFFAAPKPFLVPKPFVPVETPAFVEARQRVAARLAQLAVAQKLRSESAPQKVVAIPADVPADALAAFADAAAASQGTHLRPRKPQAVAVRESVFETAPAMTAYAPAALVFREAALRESAEVVSIAPPRNASSGSDPQPPNPPLRKPGESDALEIAA